MCLISDWVSCRSRRKKDLSLFQVKCPILLKLILLFVTFKYRLSYSSNRLLAKWYIRHAMPPTSRIDCCDRDFAPLCSVPFLLCCHGSTLASLPFWGSGCWGGGEVIRGCAFVQVWDIKCTLARYHVQQANRWLILSILGFIVKFCFQVIGSSTTSDCYKTI